MSDPTIVTIIAKSILALALIAGGVLSIIYGYRIFRDNTEGARSRMLINVLGLKITAQGAGAVIAAQAVCWGWFAVHTVPNYAASRNGYIRVYSFQTPGGSVQAPELTAVFNGRGNENEEDLKAAFQKALQNEKKNGYKISGYKALVDFRSIEQVTKDGVTYYKANLKSPNATAEVRYRPIGLGKVGGIPAARDKIVFEPEYATVLQDEQQRAPQAIFK